MSATLTAALDYAAHGWPVLPLDGKKPRNRNGLNGASVDVGVIEDWWRRWPSAGVGIRTGVASGLVVLDVDPLHGGAATLDELERQHGKLPRPHVLTGGGGHHILFSHPGGEIRNSAGAIGPGLDVRGDGGYVCAPPSTHPSGRPYKLLRPLDELEPWPAWLLETNGNGNGSSAPVVGEKIPEGKRRAAMLKVAGKLKRAGLTGDEILPSLRELNLRCSPPLDEAELRTVAYPSTIEAEPLARRLVATPFTDVALRSIEWLEQPLWQRSAFQLLSGPKGAGKGTYLAGLAARISRAGENTIFVSSEDSSEIDTGPRLAAAGADLSRCFVIRQHVRLPDDVAQLRDLALELGGAGLLVIDPVANHIGDRNSNSDAEVRHAIAPLNQLADDLACLLIGVRHPGKDRSRGALASILGSTAWVDTPRAVVMIAVDDEDPALRHIQVVAGNRSLNGSAQAFRIEGVNVPGLAEPITRAIELGESEKSVDDLLTTPKKSPGGVSADAIQAVILEALATGEKSRDYLDTVCADELSVSKDTVYRRGLAPLKDARKITPRKDGMSGGWYWNEATT